MVSNLPDNRTGTCRIAVQGRLDCDSLKAFRAAWESRREVDTYFVDFRDATTLTSTGLSLLLLLRDHAGGEKSRVHLVNCPPGIAETLSDHHFGELFTVE